MENEFQKNIKADNLCFFFHQTNTQDKQKTYIYRDDYYYYYY